MVADVQRDSHTWGSQATFGPPLCQRTRQPRASETSMRASRLVDRVLSFRSWRQSLPLGDESPVSFAELFDELNFGLLVRSFSAA